MKKNIALAVTLAALAALFLSCKTESVKKTGNTAVDGLNSRLASVAIVGFPSGAKESRDKWNLAIRIAIPVVKEVLPKVPSGYNLQVTGHTDGVGGATSAANYRLSEERARDVWNEMRKKGVTDKKLTYKGLAGTVMSDRCAANGACQRRVTFMVVPK